MEQRGTAITPKSSKNDIWKVSNEVLRPEGQVTNQMKIVKDGKVIENPQELADTFSTFFVEKVDDIVEEIKEQNNLNLFSRLNRKYILSRGNMIRRGR